MPDAPISNPAEPIATIPGQLSNAEIADLRASGIRAARECAWLPSKRYSSAPREIFLRSSKRLSKLEDNLYRLKTPNPTDDLKWLYDNLRLVRTDIGDLQDSTKILAKLPLVRATPADSAAKLRDDSIPRTMALARNLLDATSYRLTEQTFTVFIDAVQQVAPLRLNELPGMLPALKLVLMTALAECGSEALQAFKSQGLQAPSFAIGPIITSLRFIGEIDWKDTLEPLSFVDRILRQDPLDAYSRMDYETREIYRKAVGKFADHSDQDELQIANLAVTLAKQATFHPSDSDALRNRLRHVGYYLLDEKGSLPLRRQIGYRAPIKRAIDSIIRGNPNEFYIIGIEFLTAITVVALIMSIVRTNEAGGLILSALVLVLPATQAAVELMNYLVTAVLTPRSLPKLDFTESVPADFATMIAVPTLLINEKQIRQLVDDIEVRYLVNRDRYIHYALLTDLPDSAEAPHDDDPRIHLAIELIEGLNRKYSADPYGGFYLFHRHRIYNPREGAWMGFERKRGKLLDLNQYLRGVFDPFPVKAGDLKKLPFIRYVLTLDSDTQLPRSAAQKLIGTMAHPLNRPLIDPQLRIVTNGYGILQPRVGISVQSASRSHLASIYSGQTGFDIYSRAVSDVYQDLYDEGIFTGKGIYDVDALRATLEHRFPRNALLSHDLIEGAYSRVGLASDIEVIDDYPSHYSAYNRRKHRWLRGDWQIMQWIFNEVPEESGRLVRNPISLVSRWKIVDNLRRSLIEPATFLLLVLGWFVLPGGPAFWTIVSLALLFLPIYFRLVFNLVKAALLRNQATFRDSFTDFFTSHISIALNIAFLAHQSFVAVDAIVRTIIRTYITHSRLLEWETATEAELGLRKRTPVDIYLDWMPIIALAIGSGLYFKPQATTWAVPFLLAWAASPLISKWLNTSPHTEEEELSLKDRQFLREIALRTWRYYADFSNDANHWLIPDNVQENPLKIAERISPTNLGFLLNARQSALEFGYLTLSEFVSQTEQTLATVQKLPREWGHFFNWYDNLTLAPLEPRFVSSVDSGNLAASLWSLKQGCLDVLHLPIIRASAQNGFIDHTRMMPPTTTRHHAIREVEKNSGPLAWLINTFLGEPDSAVAAPYRSLGQRYSWNEAYTERIASLRKEASDYLPWLLPEFAPLRRAVGKDFFPSEVSAFNADTTYFDLEAKLQTFSAGASPEVLVLATKLRNEIPVCRQRARQVASRLTSIADQAERLVRDMDFRPLSDKRRRLLSIGYDATNRQLSKSCYDLLASEARIATFIAAAKGETPQENWFRLGRQHTLCEGEYVLVSWTGTMFEYLMGVIWMKSHPDTLLDRSVRAAVRAQQSYGAGHRVPWGISEAGFSTRDADGNYQYAAFGVPGLALSVAHRGSLVVSPYSSCLALLVDPTTAVENLRLMAKKKWIGHYGFYESADYTPYLGHNRFLAPKYDLVRSWMAHHQGMSLAAMCNVFHDDVFQRWFHAEPLVQASELILQERPLRVRPITDSQPRRILPFLGRTERQSRPDNALA